MIYFKKLIGINPYSPNVTFLYHLRFSGGTEMQHRENMG